MARVPKIPHIRLGMFRKIKNKGWRRSVEIYDDFGKKKIIIAETNQDGHLILPV